MEDHLNPQENIDEKIRELDTKAQSSSGSKKAEYLEKIRELITHKENGGIQDKAKGFMEKFGM